MREQMSHERDALIFGAGRNEQRQSVCREPHQSAITFWRKNGDCQRSKGKHRVKMRSFRTETRKIKSRRRRGCSAQQNRATETAIREFATDACGLRRQ